MSRREQQSDRLGHQPPGDERERQRRRLVQPLGIVDHTQKRTLFGDLGQQPEYPQAHQKPIGRRPAAHAEYDAQRITLWSR